LEGLYLTSFDINKIKINRKVRDFYAAIDAAQKGALLQTAAEPSVKVPEEIVKKEENIGGDPNSTVRVIKLY
jgi:hypothetical protein